MTGDKTIWVAVVLSLASFTSGCLSVKQPLAEDEGSGGSLGTGGDIATGAGGWTGGDIATGTGGWTGGDIGPTPGGAGGVPASGGWGGDDMGSGGMGCDCLPPTEPCTTTTCDASGQCVYESYASDVDDDMDGVSDACDCDDNNPDVYPGQKGYFSTPRDGMDPAMNPATGGESGAGGSTDWMDPAGAGGAGGDMGDGAWGFDYDCDYWAQPRLERMAEDCDVLPGADACVGDGWVNASGVIPACGEIGTYRVCRFADGACVENEVELPQTCR